MKDDFPSLSFGSPYGFLQNTNKESFMCDKIRQSRRCSFVSMNVFSL